MLFCRPQGFVLLPTTLIIFFTFCSSFGASSHLQPLHNKPISGGFEEVLVSWRRSVVEEAVAAPVVAQVNSTPFILAAERTNRKDPLDGFKRYTGGWNISNKHYWASVGFTAVPLFVIALIWFVGFGLALLLICCCYCCFPRRKYGYSRTAYALSLLFLMFFTIAAIIGCIVLYTGQGKFHGSTTDTLDYVVKQANLTVDNLKNFSKDLAAAKSIGVDQVFMPADVKARIDSIETRLNRSANDLAARTEDNSQRIQDLLDSVRLYLIIVAAVMLLLTFLGFLFSVVGLQFLVYTYGSGKPWIWRGYRFYTKSEVSNTIHTMRYLFQMMTVDHIMGCPYGAHFCNLLNICSLVLVGWFLVAGTFILCGVFLLLHNVVADSCIAMDEWVLHPHAHTALDDILPCVDVATANQSLYQSKEVTFQLVNIVNLVIANVSNGNFAPNVPQLYYNQSGPLMPLLCNPFTSGLADRQCVTGEVDFNNATQVWRNYICQVSSSGICTTVGRVTPSIYNQMTAAVNLSYAIFHYTPFLVQLEDCTFVRDTFSTINGQDCPGLQKYSEWIYIGLVMVSAAVMLSLIFWVIYARERRHRKATKQFIRRSAQDKGP